MTAATPAGSRPLADTALAAFRAAVGAEHVVIDPPALARVERATFATDQRIPAIVSPRDRYELQAVLRAANTHAVPVYVVSGGRNWGYGSSVPARDGAVLVSLRRMDRIVAFDERLAYVTVEPGVTFRQLFEFLHARGSRCYLERIGGPPDASLIGNAVERGIARGVSPDRFAHVCGLEVVLPDGECLHTGMARFDAATSGPVHRWGVGPALDGLFTQSNLGVVTRMTLWLDVRPAHHQSVRFSLRDPARLPALIEALRELLLARTLSFGVSLYNDIRIAASLAQYPFEPAHDEAATRLRRRLAGRAWFAEGALFSADPAHGEAGRAALARALGDHVDDLQFGAQARRAGFLAAPPKDSVASVYWRKRAPAPPDPDPDRDGCGLLWCAPVVPFAGEHVARAVDIARATLHAHGFEPGLSVQCVTARAVHLVASIVYDRDVAGEDGRAMACHRTLAAKFMEAGYLPYRLGIQDMTALPTGSDDYAAAVRRIKRALDPGDILAPGRYAFGEPEVDP